MKPALIPSRGLLARARGLQERIRPIGLYPGLCTRFDTAGNVCTTDTLVIDEPAGEVLLVHKDRTGQQTFHNLLCLGEGDIDLPLPLVTK